MSGKLVPFGRYRGQSLERMLDDKGYVEWLMQQDWFVRRFPDIHAITINWGNPEQSQTPEHNLMQARFLNNYYTNNVISRLCPEYALDQEKLLSIRNGNGPLYFSGVYHRSNNSIGKNSEYIEARAGCQFVFGKGYSLDIHSYRPKHHDFEWSDFGACGIRTEFEQNGWDIQVIAGLYGSIATRSWLDGQDPPSKYDRTDVCDLDLDWRHRFTVFLELKPHVSDDYPSVLRQMKKNRERARYGQGFRSVYALVARSVSSQVVSVEQIKAFFAASGFALLILDEHPELAA